MIVETIYTTIEKITLKKEGSLSAFTGTRIPENSSKDGSGSGSEGTDPCNDCRAGYQSGKRVSGPRNGSGTARRSGQALELARRFLSPPKTLATLFSLPLFTFLLPRVDKRTSSRIRSSQEEKNENPRCVVRISKRNLRGLIQKQESVKRDMTPMTVKTLLTLRSVVPTIPKEPEEKVHLEEDLTRIGCIGLLSKPWSVKDERMVRELTTGAPNQYEGTVRARPETWDAERWREAYGFSTGGEGFASRTDKFIGGKFRNAANPKDEFAIADCEDSKAKRVLEFLIPILYPEKPTRVTMTVGNTIFGALLDEWKVDWGIVLQAVVAKLVEEARKLKATPIGPYLFHLYMGQELLNGEEMVAYEIGLDLLKYDCTPEPDPDQGQDSPIRSDSTPSPSAKHNKRKKGDWPGSSQDRGNRNKAKLIQQELE